MHPTNKLVFVGWNDIKNIRFNQKILSPDNACLFAEETTMTITHGGT